MAHKLKIAGVYKITRTGTTQCYVGSSAHMMARKAVHFRKLRQGAHHSPHMQNIWSKHGAESLEFSILEIVEPSASLKGDLQQREQHWMDELRPCFNTLPAAYSLLGHKRTAESIQKTADALRGRKRPSEVVQKVADANRGKKRSPEAIENRAATRRGTRLTQEWKDNIGAAVRGLKRSNDTKERLRQANLGKVMSADARAKMSASHIGKKRTPESIAKSAAAHRGKIVSQETREKMRANAIAQAARRRAALLLQQGA